MKRLRWTAMRLGQNLDHLTMTVLFLAGLVMVLQFAGVTPRLQLLENRQHETAQVEARLDHAQVKAHQAIEPDSHEPPSVSRLSSDLALLHKLARENNVPLLKADYQLNREGGPYLRYRMDSEGQFSYPDFRRFLGLALEKLPHLALDNIAISRDNSDSNKPTVKLAMSLYFTGNTAGNTAP